MLTDDAGASLAAYTYSSYGNMLSHSGSATTPLLYAGQYQDAESGLYYLRARCYDPITGQFLSVDPAVASTNQPYAYTRGDPVNQLDASGLFSFKAAVKALGTTAIIAGGVTAPVVVGPELLPFIAAVPSLVADEQIISISTIAARAGTLTELIPPNIQWSLNIAGTTASNTAAAATVTSISYGYAAVANGEMWQSEANWNATIATLGTTSDGIS